MIFVDTNYFLRFLLKDINSQHKKAKELFIKGAEGKVKLFTSLIVFFEIFWVLKSFYKKNKKQMIKILINLLKMDFIKWQDKEILNRCLLIYQKKNLELEDVYNLVYAKVNQAKEIKSFDRKLEKEF